MNTEPIKELKTFEIPQYYTMSELAEILGMELDAVKNKLKGYFNSDRLTMTSEFSLLQALNYVVNGYGNRFNDFYHKLNCCKTILKSQERSRKIFDSEYGVKHLKFPPELSIYEKLFSDEEIEKVKASWVRKHVFRWGEYTPAYEDYLKAKELASYMK
ncbi:MAG: hypothetical protein WC967_14775 [Balneolaceae bacterium]